MKKMSCINLRISEEEKESIRQQAKRNDMKMTEYILECVRSYNPENIVTKKELAAMLCEIAAFLDSQEIKDTRLAKNLKRRFKEIWNYL